MNLKEVALSALVLDGRNARKHDKRNLETIGNSLDQFGQVENIVVQAGTNKVIGGNGRVQALKDAGKTHAYANMVECTDTEAAKMALALNRTADLAGWDKKNLADVVADLVGHGVEIADIGFNDAELADLVGIADLSLEDTDDDEVAVDGDADAVTKVGDIWQLGEHRLICGDSTSQNHYNALMQGRAPFMMVTDPPYGVSYDSTWRSESRPDKILNDDRADWEESYLLFTGDVAYVWHSFMHSDVVKKGLEQTGLVPRHVIIWNKSAQCMSRGAYHLKYEPCIYAVRKGQPAAWCGGRRQADVWDIDSRGGLSDVAEGDTLTVHASQKPVECMARPMRNHGQAGDLVYDPFLGSGTSIIAAVRTERICYGMELNPKFADVIVQRWQTVTGGEAVKVTHG